LFSLRNPTALEGGAGPSNGVTTRRLIAIAGDELLPGEKESVEAFERWTDDQMGRGLSAAVRERENELSVLRKSEEHFRSIIENISDVVAIVRLNGLLTYVSPSIEHRLGYRPNLLIGKPFIGLVHPDDSDKTSQFIAQQMTDPRSVHTIELRLRHDDGTWRSFEVVARSLIESNEMSGIVVNARDTTERKLLQTQLAQANRVHSLGRLAAIVAHEFNNVLMGMQPFSELMQRPDASPSMITRGAWHISNSIQRGKRITQDILRFTQPAEPVTALVDLNEWWGAFSAEAEVVIGNSIQLRSNIPGTSSSVVADRTHLSQIMSNLVSNARDAMGGGGTLTIEASEPGPNAYFAFGSVSNTEEFVHLSVTDTGRGMSPEVMEHIFEPLFTTKRNGGTGLGLAIAHQAVLQHRGHIFVESAPERGTTFHLFLPRGAKGCQPLQSSSETRLPRPQRVLIIEDEPCIVEGVSAILSSEGMEVRAVGSGSEGAGAVASFAPDVVLLDFGLPDLDGAEVYARIRKVAPDLPVIFATGHADCRFLCDGQSDSRTRFLQKPFEMTALLEVIEELQSPGVSR